MANGENECHQSSLGRRPIFEPAFRLGEPNLGPNLHTIPILLILLGVSIYVYIYTYIPTSLLCLNLPGISRAIVKNQVTSTMPKGAAIGKTVTGQWATSSLKEYPPALNRALAEEFSHAISVAPLDESVAIDDDFLLACKDMTVTKFTDVLGRDFAG